MTEQKPFDVFLSHNSQDKSWVIKLKNALQKQGLKVWLDHDEIRPGDIFVGALEDGLERSKAVALVISPEAMQSGWVTEEYSRALTLAQEKHQPLQLIPVVLREAKLPGFLANRSWIDFRDEALFQENVNRLVWGITGRKPDDQPVPLPPSLKFPKRQIKASARWLLNHKFIVAALIMALGIAGIVAVVWPSRGKTHLQTFKFNTVVLDASGQVVQRLPDQERRYFAENIADGVDLEMVEISGGSFLMGTSQNDLAQVIEEYTRYFKDEEKPEYAKWPLRETPQHLVTVPSFYIGKFEVTQAQWRAVARLPKVGRDLDDNPSMHIGDKRPVERVTWPDAVEFCARLSQKSGKNYRLPTEAEWEYACRANTKTPFAFGKTITTDIVNYHGSFPYLSAPKGFNRKATTEAGSLNVANGFGLYDMHGNVWEWCSDVWHENYESAPSDGSAWISGGQDGYRVLRGGTYYWLAVGCRSANRGFAKEEPGDGDKDGNHGFRIALAQ